jgi:hypothetical protein
VLFIDKSPYSSLASSVGTKATPQAGNRSGRGGKRDQIQGDQDAAEVPHFAVPQRPLYPVQALPGRGKDGRANMTAFSEKEWKDFKGRNVNNLLVTDASVRHYLHGHHHVLRNEDLIRESSEEDFSEGYSSAEEGSEEDFVEEERPDGKGYLWNETSHKRPLILSFHDKFSKDLQREADHYMTQFKKHEDSARYAAALKHKKYSVNAQKMTRLNRNRLYNGREDLQRQDKLLNAAHKARASKEGQYKRKEGFKW